jgi:hypothetical protein
MRLKNHARWVQRSNDPLNERTRGAQIDIRRLIYTGSFLLRPLLSAGVTFEETN